MSKCKVIAVANQKGAQEKQQNRFFSFDDRWHYRSSSLCLLECLSI